MARIEEIEDEVEYIYNEKFVLIDPLIQLKQLNPDGTEEDFIEFPRSKSMFGGFVGGSSSNGAFGSRNSSVKSTSFLQETKGKCQKGMMRSSSLLKLPVSSNSERQRSDSSSISISRSISRSNSRTTFGRVDENSHLKHDRALNQHQVQRLYSPSNTKRAVRFANLFAKQQAQSS
uniref:Uncharacterized protein n=1 Tax=Timspurckia oligopyrenoides TaxID=708627 RepID=A0A7S0ZFE9_9RHOD|mmetsp:Transcript_327/g.605  ORF Transcript_327/g.605 Transcript_327/m.605 type:complete len:175 (+) Transcript_327:425-949(+)